jgi:ubiquinone/menaquinone biosynthesis C-methylase UbiE
MLSGDMFSKTAQYYDLIYAFKDYAEEAGKIRALIQREHPRARRVLDVGCGTAEHARHLSSAFDVDGIDLEPTFIEIARRKVPAGTFTVADMRQFDLGKQYDVVLCLFSSIGYLTQEQYVVDALRCFSRHLADGGVIVVEPWFTPDAWQAGKPGLAPPVDLPDLKICRVNSTGRRGILSLIKFHYLIAAPDGVEYLHEDHELALYSVEQMLGCFQKAALKAAYDPLGISGRGLYVARPTAAA